VSAQPVPPAPVELDQLTSLESQAAADPTAVLPSFPVDDVQGSDVGCR